MLVNDLSSGDFILRHLQKYGSNLSVTHDLTYWLYFPKKSLANKAAKRATLAGLKPEILPPLEKMENPRWLCLLHCPHKPDENILDGIMEFCIKLASDFDGFFDGWESRLELPDGEWPEILKNLDFNKSIDLDKLDF